MSDENRMLNAALKYAAIGWYVFPLRSRATATHDIKMPHPMLGPKNGHLLASIDPKQIREWWTTDPKAGIGVFLAKSGLIAFDTDPKDHGPDKLKVLEAQHGNLVSPVSQISGSGGEHRIFAAAEGLSPPGKLLGTKGVDIKYNGYIVVSPSMHPNGRRYSWRKGCDPFENLDFIPNVPSWTLQYRPGTEVTSAAGVVSDDVFSEDTPKVGKSLDQISDLLELIPNSGADERDYDDWLNVLAGVYHETDGSDDAKELARNWSSQSTKHTDVKFDKSWRSLNITNKGRAPVTLRFIMKLAKDRSDELNREAIADIKARLIEAPTLAAFRKVCAEVKRLEIDSLDRHAFHALVQTKYKKLTDATLPLPEARKLVRFENTDNPDTPTWLKGWIYCGQDDEFVHGESQAGLTVAAFNRTNAVHVLTAKDRLEGRAVPEVQPADLALNLYDIPKVHSRLYLPGQDQFFVFNGNRCFNTFSRSTQPLVPDELTPADEANIATVAAHFEHMIPDPRDRGLILSWFAYIAQTERRPNWCVVMQGPEGDGKTFFTEFMGCVLGASNVQIVDPSQIKSEFSDWGHGSLLTVVEEMKLHGPHRYDVLDKLKPFITNSVVTIHPKGKKGFKAPNTAGYLMFTNFRDALPVGSNDSRYFLVASPRQTLADVGAFSKANPDYYVRLYNTLSESPGALRRWLLSLPLADEFNPSARAPYSAEKARVASLNKTDTEIEIAELIESGGKPGISEALLNATFLMDELTADGGSAPYTSAINRLLEHNLGFTFLDRFRVEGRYCRFWTRQPTRFAGMNKEALGVAIRTLLDADDL